MLAFFGLTHLPSLFTVHCLFAVRERLAAAHRHNAYRCFLPDLTKFTPACCAGPFPNCKKTENNNKNPYCSNEQEIIHIYCRCFIF